MTVCEHVRGIWTFADDRAKFSNNLLLELRRKEGMQASKGGTENRIIQTLSNRTISKIGPSLFD